MQVRVVRSILDEDPRTLRRWNASSTRRTADRRVAGEPRREDRGGRTAGALAPGLAAAGVVVGLGLADGGYFPTAWGPATLIFLAASASALVAASDAEPRFPCARDAGPARCAHASGSSCRRVWGSPTEAVPESQRALVYVSAGRWLSRSPCVVARPWAFWSGCGQGSRSLLCTRSPRGCSPSSRRVRPDCRTTGSPSRSATGTPSVYSQRSASSWRSASSLARSCSLVRLARRGVDRPSS